LPVTHTPWFDRYQVGPERRFNAPGGSAIAILRGLSSTKEDLAVAEARTATISLPLPLATSFPNHYATDFWQWSILFLLAAPHHPAGGRRDRRPQSPSGRHRPVRRAEPRDRRIQAGERDRRSVQGWTSGLLRRLRGHAGGGTAGRGRGTRRDRRRAALILGWCPRQEPDALSWRRARRDLA
jgi:hypothetical protein